MKEGEVVVMLGYLLMGFYLLECVLMGLCFEYIELCFVDEVIVLIDVCVVEVFGVDVFVYGMLVGYFVVVCLELYVSVKVGDKLLIIVLVEYLYWFDL